MISWLPKHQLQIRTIFKFQLSDWSQFLCQFIVLDWYFVKKIWRAAHNIWFFMKQISKLYMDFGFRIQDPDPDPGLGLDWKFGVRNLDLKFQIWIWVRILDFGNSDFGFQKFGVWKGKCIKRPVSTFGCRLFNFQPILMKLSANASFFEVQIWAKTTFFS